MKVDIIIFSPPYTESLDRDDHKHSGGRVAVMLKSSYVKSQHGRGEGNIANYSYGRIEDVS